MSGAAAPRRRRRTGKVEAVPPPRIGLALAGGEPLGAIYDIGALTDPRPLITQPRRVRQTVRDLAHTLDHLDAWLAPAAATRP
ncbi:MAG: hypothetical protein ABI900_04190 [Betaproteobacteria bacterium]